MGDLEYSIYSEQQITNLDPQQYIASSQEYLVKALFEVNTDEEDMILILIRNKYQLCFEGNLIEIKTQLILRRNKFLVVCHSHQLGTL